MIKVKARNASNSRAIAKFRNIEINYFVPKIVVHDLIRGSLGPIQNHFTRLAAFNQMLTSLSHGGKVSMLGLPSNEMRIDWNRVVFNMLTIKGIYGREMYESWYKMAVMIQNGLDLSPVITHEYGIDEFQQGFDVMRSGQSGKVILDWTQSCTAS